MTCFVRLRLPAETLRLQEAAGEAEEPEMAAREALRAGKDLRRKEGVAEAARLPEERLRNPGEDRISVLVVRWASTASK